MLSILMTVASEPFVWTFHNSMYLGFGLVAVLLPLVIGLLAWQRKQDRDMVCSKLCIEHNRERIEDVHEALDEMTKTVGDNREALARVEENTMSTKESLKALADRLGG